MNRSTEPIATEHVPCDLCGSLDHEFLYTRVDPVTGQEFNLVQCRCGMAFVNPMPLPDQIPKLYPSDYLQGKEHSLSLYNRMIGLLPPDAGRRLLDVGCGRGDFIRHAADAGWKPEGVDLMDWRSPYGLPVHVGDFLTMDLPAGGYDVVTAWALLEHVRSPARFFARVSDVLRPGGWFVFVVPNVAAAGMRRSCAEDIPRHLWLFTPAAVRSYLERHGMHAVSIIHDGAIYRAYPFGLLRYALAGKARRTRRCRDIQNRAVALLRNRQIKGNLKPWLSEVRSSLGVGDIILDAADLTLGMLLSWIGRLTGNYGVITVKAAKLQ